MHNVSRVGLSLVAALCIFAGPALAGEEAKAEKMNGEGEDAGMPGHIMVTPDQIEWGEVASLPAGAKATVLEGDPAEEGPFTLRIQFPPNYTVPAHIHPGTERVTVLEGIMYLAVGEHLDREHAKTFGPGALVVMDAGLPMIAYTGDESLVIQLNGQGPWGIDYLNPEEDPRNQAAATTESDE